jgi:type IV fimbrial biogenesis protein FimT
MLTHSPQRGVTLIELMVGLSIFAFLALLSAPSIGNWIRNARIRTSAESIMQGLQLAKSEAVSRNARVRFQLLSTADNSCQLSATGTNWAVSLDPNANPAAIETHCADNAYFLDTNLERILQLRPAAEGGVGVTLDSTAPSIVFNGLGRPVLPMGAGNITVNLQHATGTCADSGGELTCLRIVVSPQGQLRMCNPRMTQINASDPQAC